MANTFCCCSQISLLSISLPLGSTGWGSPSIHCCHTLRIQSFACNLSTHWNYDLSSSQRHKFDWCCKFLWKEIHCRCPYSLRCWVKNWAPNQVYYWSKWSHRRRQSIFPWPFTFATLTLGFSSFWKKFTHWFMHLWGNFILGNLG